MSIYACSNCRRPYPADGAPYRCPVCGAHFDLLDFPAFDPDDKDAKQIGIWRYRNLFGLSDDSEIISLGEGNTPCIWGQVADHPVAFKLDFLNPSGSYKDRGTTVLVSFLKSRGVTKAVEDSSGNAGASFAAYAAKSAIQARVLIPDSASGPKQKQIEAYGAEVIRIMGPRSNAASAAQKMVESGWVYASHAYLPQGLAGYATLAFELYEQLPGAPGTVVIPAGQGNLLLAVGHGFKALQKAGLIAELPCFVGVQARACAPLWAVFNYGATGMGWTAEGETLAEGVRVRYPVRGDAVLQMVRASKGFFVVVDEEEILPGRDAFARQGLYLEPTSAIVWSALKQVLGKVPEPVVGVLTGSGLKSKL
jgi:threonine synthase